MEGYFKNENIEINIEQEILYVKYFTETLTLDIVKHGIEQRLKMSKNKSFPMLADIRSIKSTPKEVRVFLSRPENSMLITAGAMLVKNLFQETVGNIFIAINQPPVPAKLFKDKNEALKWLEAFKAQ